MDNSILCGYILQGFILTNPCYRLLRHQPNVPLGGLVELFCGNFVQLPPVSGQGVFPGTYAYRAEVWPALFESQGVLLRVDF